MASTPFLSANSRSSESFSVSEGMRTGMPGRLMPLCSPSMPPLTISQITSPSSTSWTRSSIRPSESRMREPCSTFSARVLKVVPTSDAVPGTSRGVMVSSSPAFEQHRLMIFQLGGANLGSLQVAEDAERLVFLAADFTNHLDHRQLLLVGAVGKVQPDDIDASADQIPEDGHGVGGRAERGDDLGAALGGGIGQSHCCERHGSCSREG